jgi:hypothetical protein
MLKIPNYHNSLTKKAGPFTCQYYLCPWPLKERCRDWRDSELLYHLHWHEQSHWIIRKTMEYLKMIVEFQCVLVENIEDHAN